MNLQTIFSAAKEVMAERSYSSTIYSGWGTTKVDSMVREFVSNGGSWNLVRQVLNLAYYSV